MYYRPEDGHGLPHNPFNAIVAPRPIGWISTRSTRSVDNLAPYSFFNAVAYTPPQVMFASTSSKADRARGKDSLGNIEQTGVFCVNVVEEEALHEMNRSSASLAAGEDEFPHARVTKAACTEIACSRVALAPAALECRLSQLVVLEGENNFMVIGRVVGVHIRDDCLVDGKFDITRFGMVSRLGYRDYTIIRDSFELGRPDD
ncbi:flavin reductase family protein [Maritimibacter sp. DP1N21-5]|uniref:flavin reductase family protein n=1 Tax=Maritimibacter sp. DP1N21-5 TaxID=2836867 RepID=UPI001C47DFE2|nr:flavin reductase family protein [Maritimibacter sp. DP1N21-5]MBV7409324.1 flavin reductase family protein [Maritimibacter sp. DP1N21-5]